jgi:hypothetical protein
MLRLHECLVIYLLKTGVVRSFTEWEPKQWELKAPPLSDQQTEVNLVHELQQGTRRQAHQARRARRARRAIVINVAIRSRCSEGLCKWYSMALPSPLIMYSVICFMFSTRFRSFTMVFKLGVFRRVWDQGLGTIGWNYRAFTSDPSAAYASINLTTVTTPMNFVDSTACGYLEQFRRA